MKNILLSFLILLIGNNLHAQNFTPTLFQENVIGLSAVLAHDFNNDGDIEYVWAQFSEDKVSILSKEGDDLVEKILLNINGPFELNIDDYNSDGMVDILVINSLETGITILENLGNLEFMEHSLNNSNFESGREFISEDFDKDGDIDIIISSPYTDQVTLFKMIDETTFTFDITILAEDIGGSEISDADFNNDGNLDFVLCNQYMSEIYIFLNDSELNFTLVNIDNPPEISFVGPFGNATGDFNLDGLTDFAITNFNYNLEYGMVILYLNNGDGTFESLTLDMNIDQPGSIESIDINNDGKLDIIVGYEEGLAIFTNENSQTLEFNKQTIFLNHRGTDFHLFDCDNDEDIDIITATSTFYPEDPYFPSVPPSLYLIKNELVSSINEKNDLSITVIPNPFKEFLFIKIDFELEFKTLIYNQKGKLVKSSINEKQIDIKQLPKGMYFIKIIDLKSNRQFTHQIIKVE